MSEVGIGYFSGYALTMKFTGTPLDGVLIIEPNVLRDDRGFFLESYRKDLFARNGIYHEFVQDNHSHSQKGVLRGLHFQRSPMEQAKLVRVARGEVYDVVVDIRPQSKTFGRYFSHVLSADNQKMLFIPPGFAHGFLALQNSTSFVYKCSQYYSPTHEGGLRWNDAEIGITWPKLDVPYIINEKDKKYPNLKEIKF